ncbi:hypothetical protein SH668x_002009 [Planctomicrobium sp. SH668]|uniref:hypothetical protein n=1 Tax=Planctomicrobium sp. SH668 TaxID=3448126 RepID=UPI003F5B9C26
MSARSAIQLWVAGTARPQAILSVLGAVASFVGGLVCLYVTYYLLFFWGGAIAGVFFSPSPLFFNTLPVVGIALIFVAYYFADYRKLENLQFEQVEKLQIARVGAFFTGSSFLNLAAGPKTASSYVKIIAVVVLLSPALLVLSLRLIARAWAFYCVHSSEVGRALYCLLRSEQSISFSAVSKASPDLEPQQLAAELKLFDGVVVQDGRSSSCYLTELLRNELVEAVKKSRQAEAPAKT